MSKITGGCNQKRNKLTCIAISMSPLDSLDPLEDDSPSILFLIVNTGSARPKKEGILDFFPLCSLHFGFALFVSGIGSYALLFICTPVFLSSAAAAEVDLKVVKDLKVISR
jgi:hypothetical protein